MRYITIATIILTLWGCKESNAPVKESTPVTIIDQDYDKALSTAVEEDKLLFIDFYTTWCAPCKELDKYVFQNDSIKHLLGQDFVLLKYDAERDSVFHLSKKHHVGSYPTGLILNKEGFVLNRKYGFPGQDSVSLQENVIKFTDESIALNKENKTLAGYSNQIHPSRYPKFYIDFINRTNIKVDKSEIRDYLTNAEDPLAEEYFSTLIYFGRQAPLSIADMVLDNQQEYIDLYGETDVSTLLYFLSSAKFSVAISELNQEKFDDAAKFTKSALTEKWANDVIKSYEKDYLKAQDKWDEVLKINEELKDSGKFDNGYINHFSWQVFKECDDPSVIKKCIEWMKEVTDQEPNYAYLDTYAHLLHKSGDKVHTKNIAKLAIEAAKTEGRSTKTLEKLISSL